MKNNRVYNMQGRDSVLTFLANHKQNLLYFFFQFLLLCINYTNNGFCYDIFIHLYNVLWMYSSALLFSIISVMTYC
jgi:hypothetical protein